MKNEMIQNNVADKEENLKVFDAFGNFTGRYAKRSVIHKLGLFHQEVAFIPLNDKKQILLQRRSKNKKSYPNCWTLCAGHVVENQTTLEAVQMEANEELGLNLKQEDFLLLIDKVKNIRDDNNAFTTCYYKIINEPVNFFKKEDVEVEELKWFDITDFEKMIKEEKNCIFKNNEFYNSIICKLKDFEKLKNS